eukprot:TRINITY_DN6058_c0_g1_i1.p1 TRINITY_DN6058_c0_g1~~TRINITY_DN6058_c0_g1_i1.p1  ORF type:complete len:230 (+),score=53.83 TRINITY_DN6058_c0_g1_i1:33-692(+)
MALLSLFSAGSVLAVLVAFFWGIGHESQYVFTPDQMLRIATAAVEHRAATNGTVEALVDHVTTLLRNEPSTGRYMERNPEWLFNNAGGAMGAMLVLHASLSEYVIIFGTPVGTEGHSGRFLADDYFTILHGEQWAFEAGSLRKEIYTPGMQHLMPRLRAKQYRVPEECWALEYARGNIVSMMPFGLLDTLFSTADPVTLWDTVRVSATAMGRMLLMGKV